MELPPGQDELQKGQRHGEEGGKEARRAGVRKIQRGQGSAHRSG